MLDHFTHLHRFRIIAREGSMRRASEQLNVTQPALTRSMALLEAHFGKRLLVRHSRGVAPTEFGNRVLASVNRLARQWEIAETDLAQPGGAVTGTLTLRAGPLWRAVVLPEVVTALQAQFPKLSVVLENGGTDSSLEDLTEGRCDVIFGGTQAGAEMIGGLGWQQFTIVHDRVVARETHPIFAHRAADGSIDPVRILDYPWIVYTTHPIYELETIHGTAERLGRTPDIRVRTDSLVSTMALLQKGDYLCVLPEAGVRVMAAPRIVPVPIDLGHRLIHSGALYREETADWPPMARLLDLCARYFSAPGPAGAG